MWLLFYVMFILTILITPWNPSLYNFIVDILEATVTNLICLLLFKYHDSIPLSKKTILNFEMQVIILVYGLLYIFKGITSVFFNILTYTSIWLLESYPSAMCFILPAEMLHWIFLINLVLMMVLHTSFRAFPDKFLSWNENLLKIMITLFNIIFVTMFAIEKWVANWTFCSKVFIYHINNKLNLNVELKVNVFGAGGSVSFVLCLIAGLSLVIGYLSTKTKYLIKVKLWMFSQSNKNLKNGKQHEVTKIESFCMKQKTSNEVIPESKIIHVRPIEELILNPNKTESSHLDNFNLSSNNTIYINRTSTKTNEKNTRYETEQNNTVDKQNGSFDYNLDYVGLCIIISCIVIMLTIRMLPRLELLKDMKEELEVLYQWSQVAIERAFGASLPLYWLLRKEHSRTFAERKISQFLHYQYQSLA